MKFSRRKLLFGTAGAVALVPVAYAVRVSWGGYSFPKSYRHLTSKEATILLALSDALIPRQNPLGIDPHEIDVVGGVDEFLDASSELERSEIRILIWLIEHVYPSSMGFFQKFTKLSVEHRQEILHKLERSKGLIPRLMLKASKTLIAFSYFNSSRVHEHFGIKGWCGP